MPVPVRPLNRVLANPKAVAAQTFKTADLEVPFHLAQPWMGFFPLFQNQCELVDEKPSIAMPQHASWIAYPYSITSGSDDNATAVWFEQDEKRRRIRHLRLYSNEDAALCDNDRILYSIKQAMLANS